MIRDHPFVGRGIGTFMDYFHDYMPQFPTEYAHNCFLQIWAETGMFALLAFLGFCIILLGTGMKTFLRTNNYAVLGLVCGLFGFLVHSFFDTQLYSLPLSMLFWSAAGVLWAICRSEQAQLRPVPGLKHNRGK